MDDDEYFNSLMTKAERTLDDVAKDVRKHLSGAVDNIIKAGEHLQEGRDMNPSDNAFHEWCEKEFPDLEPRTRYNIMRVGARFGQKFISDRMKLTVLYQLAAPSVPDELVEEFMSSPEPVKVKDVQEAKKEYKDIQEDPELADLFEKVQQKEITPFQAIEEKKARQIVVPDYDVATAMGAIKGIAEMFGKRYTGSKEDAAEVLFGKLIDGYDQDEIGLSIARDYVKWFLNLKEVLDLAQPELEAFLDEKPQLKLVN